MQLTVLMSFPAFIIITIILIREDVVNTKPPLQSRWLTRKQFQCYKLIKKSYIESRAQRIEIEVLDEPHETLTALMMLVNVSSVQHGERRSEALIWWLCVDWNGRTFSAARRDPFEPNVFVRAKYRRAVSTTAVIGWKWIPKNLHHGQNSYMTSKRSGRRTNPLKRRPGLRSQLDAIPEECEN